MVGHIMKKRIMVVDDEPDILNSLKIVFKRHDFEVITVDNGKKCLKEIEKGFRGVVLIDLMMPELDGWDTINEIVKRGLINNVEIAIRHSYMAVKVVLFPHLPRMPWRAGKTICPVCRTYQRFSIGDIARRAPAVWLGN